MPGHGGSFVRTRLKAEYWFNIPSDRHVFPLIKRGSLIRPFARSIWCDGDPLDIVTFMVVARYNKWLKNFDERPHHRLVTPRGGE